MSDETSSGQSARTGPSWWFLAATAVCVVGVGGLSYLKYRHVDAARRAGIPTPGDLRVYGEVPDFRLIERSEREMTLADFRGRVWVADFVFSYCAGPCPLMQARMRELSDAVSAAGLSDVRFVSISVDPERDTPAVMSQYAEHYGAHPDRWLFFTGDKSAVRELTLSGFRLAVEDEIGTDQVIHSTKFVLVDRRGRLRGYYDAITPEELEDLMSAAGKPMPTDVKRQLLRDIRTLLREDGR